MSSDLEKQLERALREPAPSEQSTSRARGAALDAIPEGRPARPRSHRLGLAVIAMATAALAITGVTLAASPAVREAVGIDEHHPSRHEAAPPPDRSPLPEGASGFATVVGDRIWLARPGGGVARLRGTAFELSPNAIYAAVGRPGRLVILDPASLRRVKAHRVDGTVVAVAWAPIGIRIAYIVRHDGRFALHLIEGDLSGDTVVDRDVRPVTPAWRWDSLAVAYVGGNDTVKVQDLEFGRTVAERTPRCAVPSRGPTDLAFAPHGTRLAVAQLFGSTGWIADTSGGRSFCLPLGVARQGPIAAGGGIAWISRTDLMTTPSSTLVRIRVGVRDGRVLQQVETPSGLESIAAAPDRRTIALALNGHRLNVMVVPIPAPDAAKVRLLRILLQTPSPGWSPGSHLLWR
jgi:hypothetical protein